MVMKYNREIQIPTILISNIHFFADSEQVYTYNEKYCKSPLK